MDGHDAPDEPDGPDLDRAPPSATKGDRAVTAPPGGHSSLAFSHMITGHSRGRT